MTTVGEILASLEQFAPPALADSWDNVGLMTGRRAQTVTRVLCALDVTESVMEEAISCGAQLVVAHHPLIFTSVRAVTDESVTGRVLMRAISSEVAVICMHTNADCAQGGVNDALAAAIGLADVINMEAGENKMLGRVGNLPAAMSPRDFAAFVKQKLKAGGARFTDGGRPVQRVAVGGGACGKMMDSAAAKGADAFVIGDCSYDLMQRAQAMGLTLVDAGHFPTENPMTAVFASWIAAHFPKVDTRCSEVHCDCIEFI